MTLYDVIWTGAEFVAVGSSGTLVRSADGVAWSPYDLGYTTLEGVAWSGTRLVVVGTDSTIMTLDWRGRRKRYPHRRTSLPMTRTV